jgi:predicted dehydrogenase
MAKAEPQIKLGIIGYGFRIRHVANLIKEHSNASVVSICDIDLDRARSNAKENEPNVKDIAFFASADELLDGLELDGVLIGSNCSSHTDLAIKVMDRNIPLFLEKPIAINDQQLDRLKAASQRKEHKVVVSFPLRLTPWVSKVKEIINSGVLGKIEHVQAVNNIPYGHVYYQAWYRDAEETGGMWLQKATHDFDYINYLLDQKPLMIAAITSKQVFKGDHPEGLYCKDCQENKKCKESPYNPDVILHKDEWMVPDQYMCAFAPDAANEDSGSCIIMYESGMHIAYSQNFHVKFKAGKRGARLIGYDGTVEFDLYNDEIKVFYHHKDKMETYKIDLDKDQGHNGGDIALVENFISVISGKCVSVSTLEEGILSVATCLAAKRSSQNHTFEKIDCEL